MVRKAVPFLLVLASAASFAGLAEEKKVLRVGVTAPALSLDPKTALDSVSGLVCNQVFETPYAVLPGTNTPEPRLFASSLKLDGPLRYSAAIRKGASFSDGTPVTAALAAASLSKVKSLAEKATFAAQGEKVVITLKHPDAFLETTLSQVFCGVAYEKGGLNLGSGPYMPSASSSVNAVVLVRNPSFTPPPPIDEIRFQVYRPTSDGKVAGLVNAVKRGDIEFTNGIPLADTAGAFEDAGVAVDVTPGKSTGFLFLQTEKNGPLKDPKLRRAVALAIDRVDLAKKFFGGNATLAARSMLPPAMLGAEPDGLDFDPAKAKELIAETKLPKPIDLTLVETWTSRPYAPNPTGICRAVSDMLAKVGIRVKVIPSGGTNGFFGRVESGDFDMILAGWIADTPEPVDFLEAQMASWSIPTPGNRCGSCNNLSRYRNKNVDSALLLYRESKNPASLQAVLKASRDDVPFIPLLTGPSVTVYSKKLKGFRASPLSATFFSAYDIGR